MGTDASMANSKCNFDLAGSQCRYAAFCTRADFYRRGGVPLSTYAMFRGMLPLQGFMLAIVTFNLLIMAFSILDFGTIPNASGE